MPGKSKTTTRPATNLPGYNSNLDISSQTPIEVALKIEGNGMTSLNNLYEFLGLDSRNYSRWCKRNIINNPFAAEDIRLYYRSSNGRTTKL